MVLAAGVSEGSELCRFCVDRLRNRRLLESTFTDKRRRKEALKLIESAPARPEATGPLSGLADLLSGYNPKNPVRKLLTDQELLKNAVQSMLADAGDILASRVSAAMSVLPGTRSMEAVEYLPTTSSLISPTWSSIPGTWDSMPTRWRCVTR